MKKQPTGNVKKYLCIATDQKWFFEKQPTGHGRKYLLQLKKENWSGGLEIIASSVLYSLL